MKPKPTHKRAWEEIFTQSWWVVLFTLICYALYEQAASERQMTTQLLAEEIVTLQNKKSEAILLRGRLTDEIDAHEDPAWIELSLMRVLGLTPKNQVKVFFEDDH